MLPEELRLKPLTEWTYSDLELVLGSEESIGLELKSDLPTSDGAKGWRKATTLHKSETSGLGKEIVAFANAYGGDLLIGFEESSDHPKRADKLSDKLPNVDALVDQLKRSFSASIDPPLSGLEIRAIKENAEVQDGYVAIRVMDSLSKPHGIGTPAAAYLRKDDRSEPMTMREMQDRFFEAQTSRHRISEEIERFSLANLSFDYPEDAIAASLTLVPSQIVQATNFLHALEKKEYQPLLPEGGPIGSASLFPEAGNFGWNPNAFGNEDIFNTSYQIGKWTIDDNGTINVSGYRKSEPFRHVSGSIVVYPSWITLAARAIISFQTALSRFRNWPNIDWFFICEVHSKNAQTLVPTTKYPGAHKPVDFARPIQIKPIRFRDAYDADGMQLIGQKICNIFGLETDPKSRVMAFQNEGAND